MAGVARFRAYEFEPKEQDVTTLGGALKRLAGSAGSAVLNAGSRAAAGVANFMTDQRTPEQKYSDSVHAANYYLGIDDKPVPQAAQVVKPANTPITQPVRAQGWQPSVRTPSQPQSGIIYAKDESAVEAKNRKMILDVMEKMPYGRPGRDTSNDTNPVDNVSTVWDGKGEPKTYTTPNNPAMGLGAFAPGESVELRDGGRRTFTSGRSGFAINPKTDALEETYLGGRQESKLTPQEITALNTEGARRLSISEGETKAKTEKDRVEAQELPKRTKIMDGELGIRGFEARTQRGVATGDFPGGAKGAKKDPALLAQTVYEKAKGEYMKVSENSTVQRTPEETLAAAEAHARKQTNLFIDAMKAQEEGTKPPKKKVVYPDAAQERALIAKMQTTPNTPPEWQKANAELIKLRAKRG